MNSIEQMIAHRVRELGHRSLEEFFSQTAGEPYYALLRQIGRIVPGTNHFDIPMLFLCELHRRVMTKVLGARDFAKDSLVRSLREHLRGGWGAGSKKAARRTRVFVEWNRPKPELEEIYERVWDALKSLPPDRDWCPVLCGDPLIDKVFDIGWPE